MNAFSRNLVFLAAILVPTVWAGNAWAGSITVQLVRSSLTNIDDAAGRWQHEDGTVKSSRGVAIGQYVIVRRVDTSSTAVLNTGATNITLLLGTSSTTAPENITLQGAHNFTAGNFKGSVSAASNRFSWIQGADASYTNVNGIENLILNWAGSSQLTLP
jgi:hypothetical protein